MTHEPKANLFAFANQETNGIIEFYLLFSPKKSLSYWLVTNQMAPKCEIMYTFMMPSESSAYIFWFFFGEPLFGFLALGLWFCLVLTISGRYQQTMSSTRIIVSFLLEKFGEGRNLYFSRWQKLQELFVISI